MHLPTLPLLLSLLAIFPHLVVANNNCPTPTAPTTPTRPFTVAAFLSPYPSGTPGQISGVTMRAQGGSFWLQPSNSSINRPNTACGDAKVGCPPGNETVLWVDRWGQGWLDSENPQQVYVDTQTGALSYLTSLSTPPNTFLPGAIVTDFLHLGQGTVVSVPIPGAPANFNNPGPGNFQWIGTAAGGNPSWFACPRPGPGYQVMKDVGGYENWNLCLSGLQLVALDYSGVSPAAGVYL